MKVNLCVICAYLLSDTPLTSGVIPELASGLLCSLKFSRCSQAASRAMGETRMYRGSLFRYSLGVISGKIVNARTMHRPKTTRTRPSTPLLRVSRGSKSSQSDPVRIKTDNFMD
jgi:hypothetical protein